MNLSRQLEFDRLSLAELQALEDQNLLGVLNEMLGELKRLADIKIETIGARAACKIKAINEGRKWRDDTEYVRLDAELQKLATIISARKEQTKIVQTKVNAATRI